MKYLIEITHPHFVHFYKNLIKIIGTKQIVITCQESELIQQLLDEYGLEYKVVGKKYIGLFKKIIGQIQYFFNIVKLIIKHDIDIVIGLSPSSMLAAKVCKKLGVLFDDDDSAVQLLTKYLTIPFANYIITPHCLSFENYGPHHLKYRGYQELAYLSPKYFLPKKTVLRKYGLVEKKYVVIRFNEFKAHHDIGHSGIDFVTKNKLVSLLQEDLRVLITTEGKIQQEFKDYQLLIDPIDIHDIIAFAKIYIGDSQTMASEAAVLGTPSIRCNTFKNKISYLKELEKKYHLTYAFLPNEDKAFLQKIKEIIRNPEVDRIWHNRRNHMLSEMEDVNIAIINYLSKIFAY